MAWTTDGTADREVTKLLRVSERGAQLSARAPSQGVVADLTTTDVTDGESFGHGSLRMTRSIPSAEDLRTPPCRSVAAR